LFTHTQLKTHRCKEKDTNNAKSLSGSQTETCITYVRRSAAQAPSTVSLRQGNGQWSFYSPRLEVCEASIIKEVYSGV